MDRVIVWFSCGAASACVAKLASVLYGPELNVVCDTMATEHPDNQRFFDDVQGWIGRDIQKITSTRYESVDDVFMKRNYMSGPAGAICTVEMKAAGRGERKFTSIPGFTDEGGKPHMIPRQCTRDYKITPVRRFCAQKLRERGLKKKPGAVQLWLGISTDEALRMKPSQVKYVTHRFPLIEKKMSRNDCLEWLRSKGYEIPGKSACIGCPFRNVENWVGLTPRERSDVVLVDEVIRSIGRLRGDFYLNRKLKPMKQFFSELPTIEQLSQESQKFRNDFNNECEGMCGL